MGRTAFPHSVQLVWVCGVGTGGEAACGGWGGVGDWGECGQNIEGP
jgi:hypothetical protein